MKKEKLDIIYEDKEVIVVNKKSHLLTIATEKDNINTLYHQVREYLNKKKEKVFIVHRLDKDTSGLIIFAKNIKMKEKLQFCFEKQTVIRKYEAEIREQVELNKTFNVRQYLLIDNKNMTVYPTKNKRIGKEAITIVKTNNLTKLGTALDIEILTGRKNQIRIALKSLNFTLIGDSKYSFDKDKNMHLNAYYLQFPENIGLKVKEFRINTNYLKK